MQALSVRCEESGGRVYSVVLWGSRLLGFVLPALIASNTNLKKQAEMTKRPLPLAFKAMPGGESKVALQARGSGLSHSVWKH